MGDLSAALDIVVDQPGDSIAYGMAVVKIYQGSAVFLNSAGYATGTYSSAQAFLGWATETKDNTSANLVGGTAGGQSIIVNRKRVGTVTIATAAITDVGQSVYWTDDQTVSKTPSANYAGKIVRYNSSVSVDIDIQPATMGTRIGTVLNTNITTNGTSYEVPLVVPVAGVDTVVYATVKSVL